MKMTPLLILGLIAFSYGSVAGAEESTELFDGKSLDGWEVRSKKKDIVEAWKVLDGQIVAENPDKQGSNLWTTKAYRDYELELKYQTPSDYYDTGVFVRGDGHQVQIGISGSLKKDMTGCIYAPKDKRGSYPGKTDKITKFHQVGEWNHLKIIVTGKRIQTFLNGEPFVDYTGVAINKEGPIGLQLHAGHHMKVFFKDVRVKEL